ncbi:hypothetical protein [Ralstonia wenshanensis]|uniref:hypothetical protein n=1 Tax=Ralstonia wenshanensis TaxID=2842456 RepID=UPI003D962042
MEFDKKIPIATAVLAYCWFVALCYLLAYWNSFGIDAFQYVGLLDVIKLPLRTLVLLIGAVAIATGLFWVELLSDPNGVEQDEPNEAVNRVVSKFVKYSFLYFMAVVMVFTLLGNRPVRWLVAVFLLLPLVGILVNTFKIPKALPNSTARFIVSLFFWAVPLLAAYSGESDAQKIKEGNAGTLVEKVGVASGLLATEDHPIAYVGFLAGTFVVFETYTKSVVLLKQVDNAPLVLKNPISKAKK